MLDRPEPARREDPMHRVSRARLRRRLAAMLAGALLLGCGGGPEPGARPSFVVVLSDDQRFDTLGVVQREQGEAARFPWLETPNLDRLAEQGVRFRNAFVVNSLCAPSRAAYLTSLYGHRNGINDNATPLDPSLDTYASLLRAAGYRTGYAGKWHMGGQAEHPGFEWAASYTAKGGQGTYFDGTFEVDGVAQVTQGWVDDVTTDFAIDFLRRRRDEPFLLVVGYKAPHSPYEPESVPEPARGRYRDRAIGAAPNPLARARYAKPDPSGRATQKNERTRIYLELVSAMDASLGRLFDALDSLGLSERTVVVFASDNGRLLGEHGLSSKRSAYESAMRVPLIVRDPALGGASRGRVVDELVLNLDLAPTLLERAGVAVPAAFQGRSLRPLLEGAEAPWRSAFLFEYFRDANADAPAWAAPPTHFALRTTDAKLVLYPDRPEWTELFDLASDPGETRNLAAAPEGAAKLAELRAALVREARAVGLDPAAAGIE
jgi:arylsulfatase A-like enzyme